MCIESKNQLDVAIYGVRIYGFNRSSGVDSNQCWLSHGSLISSYSLVVMIFTHQEKGRGFWKFNNSLLSDPAFVKLVKDCINETVDEYKINGDIEQSQSPTFSINGQPLFEALQPQIRGKTISYAACKKRAVITRVL